MAFPYVPLAKQAIELRNTVADAQAKAATNEANLYFAAMMAGIDLPEDEAETSPENGMEVDNNV